MHALQLRARASGGNRTSQLSEQVPTGRVCELGGKYSYGDTYYATYGDVIDFVNFRMETASSCLLLLQEGKIADALGLCRVLLENYLLMILVCRGRKYFRLQDASDMDTKAFAAELKRRKAEWEGEVGAGGTNCIAVEKYPRAARHIMFVYEDLYTVDGEKLPVSLYFSTSRTSTLTHIVYQVRSTSNTTL